MSASSTTESTASEENVPSVYEELERLKDTEDEADELASELDRLPKRRVSKGKRGSESTLLSRKNTGLSIAGLEIDEGDKYAELSSDAESSESSHGVAADWVDTQIASPELPQEYWQVQRLVKYIKVREYIAYFSVISYDSQLVYLLILGWEPNGHNHRAFSSSRS